MRLPPNYGQIQKKSGKRRKPYYVYPPATRRDPVTGNPVREPSLGSFRTYKEALEYLNAWHNKEPEKASLTFSEMYSKWIEHKEKKGLSDSTRGGYVAAYKNLSALHDLEFSKISADDFQNQVDNCGLGWASAKKIVSLLHQMGKFAESRDYIDKNICSAVEVTQENDIENGIPFTEDDINTLWAHSEDAEGVEIALIMIYSGLRISELKKTNIDFEKWIFEGGLKTPAGRDRIVPIHPLIRDFVKRFDQKKFNAANYRNKVFYSMLQLLGIYEVEDTHHTPHDCRHTFSWLADKYKIDTLSKHLIMGHSLKGVEDAVYGHRTLDELRAEIDKIKY